MEQTQDYVRVLRLVQYEGPRDLVEKQLKMSLHGTREVMSGHRKGDGVLITAVTLDQFPQVLLEAARTPDPVAIRDLKCTITRLQKAACRVCSGEGCRGGAMTSAERALLLALARTVIASRPGNGPVLAELADQVADENGIEGRRLRTPADDADLLEIQENEVIG